MLVLNDIFENEKVRGEEREYRTKIEKLRPERSDTLCEWTLRHSATQSMRWQELLAQNLDQFFDRGKRGEERVNFKASRTLFLKAFWSLENGLGHSTITKARFACSRQYLGTQKLTRSEWKGFATQKIYCLQGRKPINKPQREREREIYIYI